MKALIAANKAYKNFIHLGLIEKQAALKDTKIVKKTFTNHKRKYIIFLAVNHKQTNTEDLSHLEVIQKLIFRHKRQNCRQYFPY